MNKYNFSPFPILQTNSFILRKLSMNDAAEIFITRSDEVILKYLDIPKAKSLDDAKQFIEKIIKAIDNNESIYWVINKKNDSKLIGTICLWNLSENPDKAEIGFVLLPDYHGKGIMQEVIPAMLDYGFNSMKLDAIDGEVDPANLKSVKLMEKFGFKYDSKLTDTVIYSLHKENYKSD